MSKVILVSVSGGKDSTAALLKAIEYRERHGDAVVMAAFADTGNEHPSTVEYVNYLESFTGIKIHHVKADFSERFAHRAEYVREKWPDKLIIENGKTANEADEIVQNALSIFEKGSSGNPFLDLCILKGRFPSRMAQFCTQELKTMPLTQYALELLDKHGDVQSWQGVRADESEKRSKLPAFEDKGGGYTIFRPILKLNVEQVFEIHKKHGCLPNPLYSLGMNRVGCMPCINCSKNELFEISRRFHEHIDRIEEWERILCKVSKRQSGTFFASIGESETAFERGNIRQKVEWSKTMRGGKKYDLFKEFEEISACSSSYGLCE